MENAIIDNFVKVVAEQTKSIQNINKLVERLCIINGICPVCREIVGQDPNLALISACKNCREEGDLDLKANKPN